MQIQADSTNGTLFYDVDARSVSTIRAFSSVSTSLPGKFVRVAARYQLNGSLTAVRIWASSTFNNIWISPEGHVLHVDANNGIITVQNELGTTVPITVNSSTEFFYRVPASALTDATAIGTGTSFLANIVRDFKVHVGVVDPLASPLVAQTIDIEIARFDGMISNSNSANFTYTRLFRTSTDDYTETLPYISSTTPNGKDANGNQIDGFKWWDFTFPTLLQFGSNAIANFVAATSGAVNFGGSTSPISAWGISNTTWNDPANPTGWAARWVVLAPSRIPLGTVATPWTMNSNGGSFGMAIPNGTNTVTVTLSSVSGSATLVYQVDDTNGIVTISPQDITTQTGLQNVSSNLGKAETLVKVFRVPQPNGTLQAYVLFYLTGASSIQ